MTVDTSALVAVAFNEPTADRLIEAMGRAEVVRAGTPTLFETGMVFQRRFGARAGTRLKAMLREFDIAAVPFDEAHYEEALRAFQKYGRGRHAAALNLGDCMAYAVASLANDTLLFVGEDFAKTDIRRA